MRIDENVDDTLANVDAGQAQLLKYLSAISSNRWVHGTWSVGHSQVCAGVAISNRTRADCIWCRRNVQLHGRLTVAHVCLLCPAGSSS